MIEVTTIGSHSSRQAFGEVCHYLVDVFLWQFIPDFQLINHLGHQLEFMVVFSAWHTRDDSSMGSNLESLGPMILLNEPRTVHLQPVLRDALHVSFGAVLLEDEL